MSTEVGNLWWKCAVIYELYVDKFAGNFKALAKKIPYLADLGVNCVHILPHYPLPMIDDGYDVSDYCAVRKDLGTLGDFDFFIKEASGAGIRVMVDLVLNHTSTKHPWFLKAVSDLKSPERGYYFSTFYPEQADLNWDNPLVFNEICRVMDFWALHGVSAFRFDAISHLAKREGTNSKSISETHAVIKKIRKYTDEHYPNIAILGEIHDVPEKTQKYFGEGEGDECHLLYHFPLAEAFAEIVKRHGYWYIWEIFPRRIFKKSYERQLSSGVAQR